MTESSTTECRRAGRSDYAVTFVVEGLNTAAWILTYRIAAALWGQAGFAEYALVRRTVSWLVPAMLLGVGVGIARFGAYAQAKGAARNGEYLTAGAALVLVFATCVLSAIVVAGDEVAHLIFGGAARSSVVTPLAALAFGQIVHSLNYAFLRGQQAMVSANALQFAIVSAVPLSAMWWFPDSIESAILAMGAGTALLSLAVLVVLVRRSSSSFDGTLRAMRELVQYGLPRVPGDIFLMLLLALPATVAAHQVGFLYGGYVAFGLSLLGLAGSALAPISIVQLPQASRMFGEGRHGDVAQHLKVLLSVVTVCTLGGILAGEVLLPVVVRVFLGEGILDAVPPARIILIAALPYAIFLASRSVIDAYHVGAVNSRNVLAGFLTYCVLQVALVVFLPSKEFSLLAFLCGMTVLGILTLNDVRGILTLTRTNAARPRENLWRE